MMRISPTASIVVWLEKVQGRLAALAVSRGPTSDQWAFPGGYIEVGESAIQAASRELAEETGYKIPPRDLRALTVIGKTAVFVPSPNAYARGKLQSSEEGVAAWVDVSIICATTPFIHEMEAIIDALFREAPALPN